MQCASFERRFSTRELWHDAHGPIAFCLCSVHYWGVGCVQRIRRGILQFDSGLQFWCVPQPRLAAALTFACRLASCALLLCISTDDSMLVRRWRPPTSSCCSSHSFMLQVLPSCCLPEIFIYALLLKCLMSCPPSDGFLGKRREQPSALLLVNSVNLWCEAVQFDFDSGHHGILSLPFLEREKGFNFRNATLEGFFLIPL